MLVIMIHRFTKYLKNVTLVMARQNYTDYYQ